MKLFALVTDQGTAAAETCLCENHIDVNGFSLACRQADIDVRMSKGFVDCSENEELECIVCGATKFS